MKFLPGKLYKTKRQAPQFFLYLKQEDALADILFRMFYTVAIFVLDWTIFCLSPFWFHETVTKLRMRFNDLVRFRSIWSQRPNRSHPEIKETLKILTNRGLAVKALKPGTMFMVVSNTTLGRDRCLQVLAGNASGWIVVEHQDLNNILPVET